MKDEDFELLGVLIYDRQTDGRTDICDCTVAFATEKGHTRPYFADAPPQ